MKDPISKKPESSGQRRGSLQSAARTADPVTFTITKMKTGTLLRQEGPDGDGKLPG